MEQGRLERFQRAHGALRTAAVTGTNGKTTTVSMIASIIAASGEPHARLTTLGAWVNGEAVVASTPADEFLETVERAVAQGVKTLALEMTSKALLKGLARRWRPHVSVFTNLSRDHLDMHQSPEEYLAAKAQLFMALPPKGVAVLNAECPASALIEEVIPTHARVVHYSLGENADLGATRVEASLQGTTIALAPGPLADAMGGTLQLEAVGAVHAQNALGAALACAELGYAPAAIHTGLQAFRTVPGRFEIVREDPVVVVDYAHTPVGLAGTLATARQLVGQARVICVFGCGGERDKGKRPIMGQVAHRGADIAVLTSDNPRREDPDEIADDIVSGVSGVGARWHRDMDRGRAIDWAISEAGSEDLVVIAGKGHEVEQEIEGVRLPFSDRERAQARGST